MLKGKKGSGDFRARFHTAMLPYCEKKLKNILSSGVVLHTFSHSTKGMYSEACRSLSSSPSWSTNQVPQQSSLEVKKTIENRKLMKI